MSGEATDPIGVGPLDVLVVGSGVAGLSAAVRLAAPLPPSGDQVAPHAAGLRVGVLTKAELSQSATRWAQGGVAAVLGGDEDSTDLHLADTLAAGAGLCDTEAVRVLVDEGPSRVRELIAMGAVFDCGPGGALALAREGGHSTARVVHAGGAATGAEVERALVDATRTTAAAVLEEWFALDLLVEGGRCRGVRALSTDGRTVDVRATHTVLATGGAGQLFAVTTNPAEATADGLAMALRAGVPVADVEFMQFHPTALHHPAMPRPLLSEALRGHGALLRDARGDRFVDELAPRDVVSRAMAERMREQGVENLWLDATGLDAFGSRFPTIAASITGIGLDPSRLVADRTRRPTTYSGGVLTDLSGATALPGLWAAGEVACTGVHGANRLASNSLLEGMVFGARLAEAIARRESMDLPRPGRWPGSLPVVAGRPTPPARRSLDASPGLGRARAMSPGHVDTTKGQGRAPTGDDRRGRSRSECHLSCHRRRRGPGDGRAGRISRTGRPRRGRARQPGHRGDQCPCVCDHSLRDAGRPRPERTTPQTYPRWRRRILHTADGVLLVDVPPPQAGQGFGLGRDRRVQQQRLDRRVRPSSDTQS